MYRGNFAPARLYRTEHYPQSNMPARRTPSRRGGAHAADATAAGDGAAGDGGAAAAGDGNAARTTQVAISRIEVHHYPAIPEHDEAPEDETAADTSRSAVPTLRRSIKYECCIRRLRKMGALIDLVESLCIEKLFCDILNPLIVEFHKRRQRYLTPVAPDRNETRSQLRVRFAEAVRYLKTIVRSVWDGELMLDDCLARLRATVETLLVKALERQPNFMQLMKHLMHNEPNEFVRECTTVELKPYSYLRYCIYHLQYDIKYKLLCGPQLKRKFAFVRRLTLQMYEMRKQLCAFIMHREWLFDMLSEKIDLDLRELLAIMFRILELTQAATASANRGTGDAAIDETEADADDGGALLEYLSPANGVPIITIIIETDLRNSARIEEELLWQQQLQQQQLQQQLLEHEEQQQQQMQEFNVSINEQRQLLQQRLQLQRQLLQHHQQLEALLQRQQAMQLELVQQQAAEEQRLQLQLQQQRQLRQQQEQLLQQAEQRERERNERRLEVAAAQQAREQQQQQQQLLEPLHLEPIQEQPTEEEQEDELAAAEEHAERQQQQEQPQEAAQQIPPTTSPAALRTAAATTSALAAHTSSLAALTDACSSSTSSTSQTSSALGEQAPHANTQTPPASSSDRRNMITEENFCKFYRRYGDNVRRREDGDPENDSD